MNVYYIQVNMAFSANAMITQYVLPAKEEYKKIIALICFFKTKNI